MALRARKLSGAFEKGAPEKFSWHSNTWRQIEIYKFRLCKFSAKHANERNSMHPSARMKFKGLIITTGLHHVFALQFQELTLKHVSESWHMLTI